MIVEYWSDFTCPFCYIAETRMKRVLKELGINDQTKIVFKAFELNPESTREPKRTIVEGFMRHYCMSEEQAAARVEQISAMGRAEGLDFRYATAMASNTFDALRLTKLAQSKGNDFGNEFVERMYKAFFSRNLIMSHRDTLEAVASEAGLDPAEVKELLDGDRYAAEVRADENEAYSLGINAVPFFAVNRRYGIPGAVDAEDMMRALRQAFNEEEAEAVRPGMVCGPDGCHPADE